MRNLSVAEARAFYDRFGAKQDRQVFYEGPALAILVANARLGEAQSIFEYGCGTGRFAQELLDRHLPKRCRYLGVDISSTMVRLAAERLVAHSERASVVLTSGEATVAAADSSIDRFMATYVFDLLPASTALRVVAEAHRVLSADGLLCLAGITHGVTPLSRLVMSTWLRLVAWKPSLVGGCRPTCLADLLSDGRWQIVTHQTVVAWGVASEVVIAAPVRIGDAELEKNRKVHHHAFAESGASEQRTPTHGGRNDRSTTLLRLADDHDGSLATNAARFHHLPDRC